MSDKNQLPVDLSNKALNKAQLEAEEEKRAALIRMAKILEEYQLMVQKGFKDLEKK